jgi:hypothetical protein
MTQNGKLYQLDNSEPLTYEGAGFVLPTPRASDCKGSGPIGSKSYKHMVQKKYLCAVIQQHSGQSGKLNPSFVEWMMGFPPGYTELND